MSNESINKIVNSIYWYKGLFRTHIEIELKNKFNITLHHHEDKVINENLALLGQLLVNLNHESVNYRYDEKTEPFNFEFSDTEPYNKVQLLKSIECFLYQSCEKPNYKQNKTYLFIEDIKNCLQDEIINGLEEYKKAKWE